MVIEPHYCQTPSPIIQRFGTLSDAGRGVTSHVLHENGTRCFNPHYFRDAGIKLSIPPWAPVPKEI